MTSKNIYNNIELSKILKPRITPYLWDIVGYIGGLVTIFYYDKVRIIIYSILFVLYGLLNIVFDIYSVSIEYSNNAMPNYKNIGNYNFYITNKKYILQNENNSLPFDKINIIDNSKLKINLSVYVGDYIFIKYLLFVIYLLGITKRNYTINSYDDFKDNIIYFV